METIDLIAEGDKVVGRFPHGLLDEQPVDFLSGSQTDHDEIAEAIAAAQPDAISLHSTPRWKAGSAEDAIRTADADALVTMLLVDRSVGDGPCNVVVDLFVPERAEPFADRLAFGIIPSNRVFASSIAWLAVSPELGSPVDALFQPAHVRRTIVPFGPPDNEARPFAAVQEALLHRKQAALAVVQGDGSLDLQADTQRLVHPGDHLLVFERLDLGGGRS